jgi:YegS/Rv2252/BmrU family lipid kinase
MMGMKKLLFVFNRFAGKGQVSGKVGEIIDIFVKNGYEVTAHPTQKRRDGYRKIRDMSDDFDLVVCSGGDGTLDEAVTAMMQRAPQKRVPIGYIPAGSTNDFANSLHIPVHLLDAAETAVNGVEFRCDVGHFNDQVFVYVAAFGLFTDVSYETKQELKNVLGHLAYVLEGAKRLYNIPSYRLKVVHDDEVIEGEFIYGMVTNSKSVGGFKNIIGKNVVFDDGEFEVTLIKMPKNPLELNEIIAALLIEQIDTVHMYTFKARELYVECEGKEMPWTLDGEYGGTHDAVTIRNGKQELGMMVPEDSIPRITNSPELYEKED